MSESEDPQNLINYPAPPQIDPAPSLEELFSKDPNDWTDPDIENIVQTLRSQRNKFNLAEGVKQVEGKKPKATALPKPKPSAKDVKGLSLGDLGLLD